MFKYIRSYYSTAFNPGYLLSVLAMLALLIWVNYYHIPIKNIVATHNWAGRFVVSYSLYLIPFAIAYALQYFFYPHTQYLRNKKLLSLIILSPAIFALRANFTLHHPVIQNLFSGHELVFWKFCTDWLIRAAVILLAVFGLTKLYNKSASYSPEGLTNVYQYLLMIGCLLPFIIIAAFQPSFMEMYPRAQLVNMLALTNKPLYYFVFELSYAIDFISIEAFFRGFLLFAFMRTCGMNCIVPAACFYCCIHFGKPMTEAISSFWGGLLLGIVSYHTKNIWGGIIVHIGIAALMEIAGFAAHLL